METYFNQASDTHLSKTSKTNFTKFMADKFEATSTGTATKLQCQNCKQRFSKHFILPMYPQSLQLCDSNTYLFCWACLQAPGEQNYMVHPGPWLNNTTDAESANMEPTKNLNQIQNRPWALQSLDADFGKDFAPFVWTIAVRPDAHSAQEGVIQHSWNHQLNRWQRFPLSHVSEGNRITRYDLTEFQRLTSKVWKLKAANLAKHHHLITRASTYAQTLHQLRFENPYVEDSELRARTLKTLNFISNHAAASFFQIPAEQRQQILDTFIKWETNRIQAGLTGLDSSLHDAIHSDTNDLFLKQFWTVVLPSLHHHFICRNPDCKKVVMSHHWATTVKHGARKQGHYLCPSCLAIYRPFADADHKGKPLLKPKQCLVVKTEGAIHNLDTQHAQTLEHEDRPDVQYYLYLMEWPEETTDQLLNHLTNSTPRTCSKAMMKPKTELAFPTKLSETNSNMPRNSNTCAENHGHPATWKSSRTGTSKPTLSYTASKTYPPLDQLAIEHHTMTGARTSTPKARPKSSHHHRSPRSWPLPSAG